MSEINIDITKEALEKMASDTAMVKVFLGYLVRQFNLQEGNYWRVYPVNHPTRDFVDGQHIECSAEFVRLLDEDMNVIFIIPTTNVASIERLPVEDEAIQS